MRTIALYQFSGVLEGSDNYDNLKPILSEINALIISSAQSSTSNLKFLRGGKFVNVAKVVDLEVYR